MKLGSLVLATLLLAGCGSAAAPDATTQSSLDAEHPYDIESTRIVAQTEGNTVEVVFSPGSLEFPPQLVAVCADGKERREVSVDISSMRPPMTGEDPIVATYVPGAAGALDGCAGALIASKEASKTAPLPVKDGVVKKSGALSTYSFVDLIDKAGTPGRIWIWATGY